MTFAKTLHKRNKILSLNKLRALDVFCAWLPKPLDRSPGWPQTQMLETPMEKEEPQPEVVSKG